MKYSFFRMVTFLDRHQRSVLAAAAILFLAAGVLYSIGLGNNFRYEDERDNVLIATNIATKGLYSLDGIEPCAFIPPAYASFLAPLIHWGATIVHLRVINYLLLLGSVVVFYLLLRQHSNTRVAVFGALIALGYPLFFYIGGTLFPQTFSMFLFAVFLRFLFQRPFSNVPALLAGVTVGVLVLTVQTFLFVLVFSTVFLMTSHRAYRQAAVMVVSALLVVGFWVMRNYIVFHEVVPLAANLDYHLLVGNCENATPTSGVNVDISQDTVGASTMKVLERYAFYRTLAFKWIVNNPSQAAKLYFGKVLNHFHYMNRIQTSEESSSWRNVLLLLSYGPLLILFFARYFFRKKYPLGELEKFFMLLYVLNGFHQAIFFTRVRFRVPYDFLLIGVAAMTIVILLDIYSKRSARDASATRP